MTKPTIRRHVILVGHSYDGFVIANAAYNNPKVKGLVYVAVFAPNQGQSLSNFLDFTKWENTPITIGLNGTRTELDFKAN